MRNPALDFTKGVLVLFMILYHWINYFVSVEVDIYRYLRFITPSFIFISGFLITNIYLAKYDPGDPRLRKRLAQRGLKLLAVFTVLNLTASLVTRTNYNGRALGIDAFIGNLFSIYLAGNGGAAFFVLVPISYLLLLSAGLLLTGRLYKYCLYVLCLALYACIFTLGLNDVSSGNLELIAVGVLGMILGAIPVERINDLARHPYQVFIAYIVYLGAISIWNVIYPLQVVGVCGSLLLIYMLGIKCGDKGMIQRSIILLGRYSLLAYIAQIIVLQLLRGGVRYFDLEKNYLLISLVGAFVLTMLIVEIVEKARRKVSVVDKFYSAVFS